MHMTDLVAACTNNTRACDFLLVLLACARIDAHRLPDHPTTQPPTNHPTKHLSNQAATEMIEERGQITYLAIKTYVDGG
jgi:hypothetical protein